MELKPIGTKAEYKAALREIEALFDAPGKTPEADRLEVLAMLVEKYEAWHYPIPAPDPIDFLNYAMEARGLTRKDLEPYIGSCGRVAEVLNRVRPAHPDDDPAIVGRPQAACGCADSGLRTAPRRMKTALLGPSLMGASMKIEKRRLSAGAACQQ